jgi:hypothetical protein
MDRIRVFISSTQVDMQPERNVVESVINKLGCECLRAETHTAPAKSPVEACRGMARDCDIYVGVYGERYGSVDDGIGISITEMEYDEARAENSGKLLVYIKQQDEYELRQRQFLAKVQDFHIGYFRHEFFGTLDKLCQQVESDLVSWVAERVHKVKSIEKELRLLKIKTATLQNYYRQVGELQNLPKEILL